jgi:hypothetical protein
VPPRGGARTQPCAASLSDEVDKHGGQQDEDPAYALQGVDANGFDIQGSLLFEAVGMVDLRAEAPLAMDRLGISGVPNAEVGAHERRRTRLGS